MKKRKKVLIKTLYENLHGRKLDLSYLKIIGSTIYILRYKEQIARTDELKYLTNRIYFRKLVGYIDDKGRLFRVYYLFLSGAPGGIIY